MRTNGKWRQKKSGEEIASWGIRCRLDDFIGYGFTNLGIRPDLRGISANIPQGLKPY
jgi:hypothetical protein